MDCYITLFRWGLHGRVLGKDFKFVLKRVDAALKPAPIHFKLRIGKEYQMSAHCTGFSRGELVIQLFGWRYIKIIDGISYDEYTKEETNG